MILARRRFLFAAAPALLAAPAIVRVAANLMPVSTKVQRPWSFGFLPHITSLRLGDHITIYGTCYEVTQISSPREAYLSMRRTDGWHGGIRLLEMGAAPSINEITAVLNAPMRMVAPA